MTPELRALQRISLGIATDVRHTLQASLVMGASRMVFHGNKRWFKHHPANTLHFTALRALEERSVVAISEDIEVTAKSMPVPKEIVEEWAALVPHRHALSHPSNVTWRKQFMRDFTARAGHYREHRGALIWRAQQAMNARLSAAGLRTYNSELVVTHAMV
jgi:hypothetical protein